MRGVVYCTLQLGCDALKEETTVFMCIDEALFKRGGQDRKIETISIFRSRLKIEIDATFDLD